MTVTLTDLPGAGVLERQLARVLGVEPRSLVISERLPNPYASRLASEIVTVALPDGTTRRFFCKHGSLRQLDVHDLRAGLEYEADVYREVLRRASSRTAAFAGFTLDPVTGRELLALESLDGFVRVQKSSHGGALATAAEWIGRFHLEHEGRGLSHTLNVYDEAYYASWIDRAIRAFPGLASLAGGAACQLSLLIEAPQTVIHGEYYPDNVLIRNSQVCPVDWEWAALAAGEIDLAALTEGWWGTDQITACVDAYASARWPSGAPSLLESRLDAARLYLHLRWLGGGGSGRRGSDGATVRCAEVKRLIPTPISRSTHHS